jgi:putative DNA-invertase from lambdoid prophage Rac
MPDPTKSRCAIYARVSTEDQDCEIQLTNLRGFASRSGWEATEYVEKISGKEGNRRPQLEALLSAARLRWFDVVIVWKLDRFGRSTLDTLENVRTLDQAGVRFLCPSMGIDTDQKNPVGKFILTIFAAIAELERGFILERTLHGFKAYREAYAAGRIGTRKHSKSGKDLPVGRPRVIFDRQRVRSLRAQGKSIRQIAAELGIGRGTIERALAA